MQILTTLAAALLMIVAVAASPVYAGPAEDAALKYYAQQVDRYIQPGSPFAPLLSTNIAEVVVLPDAKAAYKLFEDYTKKENKGLVPQTVKDGGIFVFAYEDDEPSFVIVFSPDHSIVAKLVFKPAPAPEAPAE